MKQRELYWTFPSPPIKYIASRCSCSILYSNGNFGFHLAQGTGNFQWNLQEQLLYSLSEIFWYQSVFIFFTGWCDIYQGSSVVCYCESSEIENQDQCHRAPFPEIYVIFTTVITTMHHTFTIWWITHYFIDKIFVCNFPI